MNTPSKPYCGLTHFGDLGDKRWATVIDWGNFAELTKWFAGCGLSRLEITFGNAAGQSSRRSVRRARRLTADAASFNLRFDAVMETYANQSERERIVELPTVEAMHTFLKQHYKHDRFEGRNNSTWGETYSRIVAQGAIDHLSRLGMSCVSHYDSKTGDAVWFGPDLKVLTDQDEIRARLRGRK